MSLLRGSLRLFRRAEDHVIRSCAAILTAIVVTTFATPGSLRCEEQPKSETENAAQPAGAAALRTEAEPGRMEARFADGSVLKLRLLDTQLNLKTDYGDLRIPVSEIRRIDFATRLSDELAGQIATAIAELGHEDYDVRETASRKLAGIGAPAYSALLKAAEHPDAEVAHRAEKLVASICAAMPVEQYEVRTQDVVYTAKSKIAGRIDAVSLRVGTEAFGEQGLALRFLRSLRIVNLGEAASEVAQADPGSLSNYQGKTGVVFRFQVTGGAPVQQFGPGGRFVGGGGMVGGNVWGSDPYTLDSTLAVAAVHAGVLKSGETGVVTVTILGPQNAFAASTRNGVTTSAWGAFPGAFTFVQDEDR
ncbi:MAG TPA: LCCL domain-containing protein [Pirellulales bacterium]|nr:LCCL domain-containing protein [Pirellulales bacterium]